MGPPSGFGKDVNDYLNHYVTVADTKAAGVLTLDLALAGFLISDVPTGVPFLCLHWGALLLLLMSGSMALLTLYPRTPKIGSSLIFWEDIASRKLDDYLALLGSADSAEIERQYGAQNHLVSGVLQKKYKIIRWGVRMLMCGLLLTALRMFE